MVEDIDGPYQMDHLRQNTYKCIQNLDTRSHKTESAKWVTGLLTSTELIGMVVEATTASGALEAVTAATETIVAILTSILMCLRWFSCQ